MSDGKPAKITITAIAFFLFLVLFSPNSYAVRKIDLINPEVMDKLMINSGDVTPPLVGIISPTNGSQVSGAFTVRAHAFDNVGVVGVQFKLDGVNFDIEDRFLPYRAGLDTTNYSNGSHVITAVARDAAGNTTVSNPITININNPGNNAQKNVVLIVTDDQRWDSMQYMPLTNQLLGNQSVKFNNAFSATSICCPSRISMLTGLYAYKHGYYFASDPIDYSKSIASWLNNAGYRTGLYGKYTEHYWNIAPFTPPGWDEWHALEQQTYYNYRFVDNGVFSQTYGSDPEDYSTDVIFTRAADFISSTPSTEPLFLYVTPFGPHSPGNPAPIDEGSYASLPDWRPPSFNEADVSDKPTWVQNLPLLTSEQIAGSDALHRSQVESLQSIDRGIKKIYDTLNVTGRLSNTMIIFISDNGLSWGEHRWSDSKACVYDECVRVPLWVRVPGVGPRTESKLALNIDMAPTIAAWAGVPVPNEVDGLNLVSLITNPSTPWRDSVLLEVGQRFSDSKAFQAVRTSTHLYSEFANGERELYDLVADPYQLTNIIGQPGHAMLINELRAKLDALRGTSGEGGSAQMLN